METLSPAYQIMKVFDCQDMPDEICSSFLESWDKCNDCALAIDMRFAGSDGYLDWEQWLLDNGVKEDETVIVKYWW